MGDEYRVPKEIQFLGEKPFPCHLSTTNPAFITLRLKNMCFCGDKLMANHPNHGAA